MGNPRENEGLEASISKHRESRAASFRPFSLFLTILVSIFAVETLIMLFLGPLAAQFSVAWALLDAFLLALIVFPLLYYLSLKPLQRSILAKARVESEKNTALEFDRIKSEFISSAAHELLTPLTSIRGYVEMLQSGDDAFDARQRRDFLDTIYHQTEVLERIVDDMLDLGRIESGQRIKLRLVTANLNPVLEKAATTFRQLFPDHLLTCSFPDHLPPLLMDPIRIDQVLANLLSNAGKYSDPGQPVLLSVAPKENLVVVQVQDRGIGMTPEQLEHVYEYFYRVDTSDTKRSGLGLGLSISKLIIEEHGGKMHIESTPGEGTIAGFSLPVPGP